MCSKTRRALASRRAMCPCVSAAQQVLSCPTLHLLVFRRGSLQQHGCLKRTLAGSTKGNPHRTAFPLSFTLSCLVLFSFPAPSSLSFLWWCTGTSLLYDHCKNHPEWVDPDMLIAMANNASQHGAVWWCVSVWPPAVWCTDVLLWQWGQHGGKAHERSMHAF